MLRAATAGVGTDRELSVHHLELVLAGEVVIRGELQRLALSPNPIPHETAIICVTTIEPDIPIEIVGRLKSGEVRVCCFGSQIHVG